MELKFLREGRVGEKEAAWDRTQTGHQQSWPSELGTSSFVTFSPSHVLETGPPGPGLPI